jgi:hypothetical protein
MWRVCSCRSFPLYGVPKWHPYKKREWDGALTLGGHHLMGEYNNQPNYSVGSGGGVGEETLPGRNMWGGRFPIIQGGKLSNEKLK